MMNSITVSAVIFDMDGLMFDTERIARIAWEGALADWGYQVSEPVYFSVVGKAAPDVQAIFVREFGKDLPIAEITRRKDLYMEAAIRQEGLPVKPGLLDLLDSLGRWGVRTAVASSTARDPVMDRLERAGIAHRFDVVIGGDEVKRSKPEPDLFLAAARRLDVLPRECVVLEDSEAGIRAAHAAGMTAVMVPDLKPPSDEVVRLACRVLSSLGEARDFLAGAGGFSS